MMRSLPSKHFAFFLALGAACGGGGGTGAVPGSTSVQADPMCNPDLLQGALAGSAKFGEKPALSAVFGSGGVLRSIDGASCTADPPYYNTAKCLDCNWVYHCGRCAWRVFIDGTNTFHGPFNWSVQSYISDAANCPQYFVNGNTVTYRLKPYVSPAAKPACASGACLSSSDCPSGQECNLGQLGFGVQTCRTPSGGGGGTVICGGTGDHCSRSDCCASTVCCGGAFCGGDCIGTPCC